MYSLYKYVWKGGGVRFLLYTPLTKANQQLRVLSWNEDDLRISKSNRKADLFLTRREVEIIWRPILDSFCLHKQFRTMEEFKEWYVREYFERLI